MRLARARALMPAMLASLCLASAAAGSAGLDATITDTLKYDMRLTDLKLRVKPKPGSGGKPATLERFIVVSGRDRLNLWISQIATAEFSQKAKGRIEVKAVLQGQGDQIAGVVEGTARCYFEGRVAEGRRKGRVARVPITEVKALKIHTVYKGVVRLGKAGEMIPMPAPDQDVLWVSSVPFGANVYAKPFDCAAANVWKEYMYIGKTPLMRELGAGKYAVKIMVPAKLAAALRPSTKLGEDTNPFEHDGWGEIHFKQNENVISSVVYTVIKTDGRSAVLISLFQRKGASLDEVVAAFPEGHNFDFSEKKLEGALLFQQIPKTDIPKLVDGLRRGGKIIWHGKTKSMMIELTPGPRGWKIGGAQRPKK